MSSKTEQILEAIKSAIAAQGVSIERNVAVPLDVPSGGLLILRDGKPGEPDTVMGGFDNCYYSHDIEIEVFVQAGSDSARDDDYDDLIANIKAGIYADRTFGGLIYGFTTSMPEVQTLAPESGAAIKAGSIVLRVEYETDSPLG